MNLIEVKATAKRVKAAVMNPYKTPLDLDDVLYLVDFALASCLIQAQREAQLTEGNDNG